MEKRSSLLPSPHDAPQQKRTALGRDRRARRAAAKYQPGYDGLSGGARPEADVHSRANPEASGAAIRVGDAS